MENTKKEWLNVKEVMEIYNISRPFATKLLGKFKSLPKYKGAFTQLGYRTKKFKAVAVEEFMLAMDNAYLKE